MRNSSNRLIIGLLLITGLVVLSLFLFQSAWLKIIMYMLKSSESAALPISSTPITGFSIPTARPPAPAGVELAVGDLGITVTRVTRPADFAVRNAHQYKVLDQDEEYLMVEIKVRCISSTETCV